MVEGFSGRIPISKMILIGNNIHICNLKTYKIYNRNHANGNVTKDNISRVEKDRERNLPLYSVKTHKIYKGLHVNYLNGQEIVLVLQV